MKHNQIVCRLPGLTIGAAGGDEGTIGLYVGDRLVPNGDMQELLSGEIDGLVWMSRTEARLLISALKALLDEDK